MNDRELTDAQFALIASLLPFERTMRNKRDRLNRQFVEAVLWRFRTGARWCDLPRHYGSHKGVRGRFDRWARERTWIRLWEALEARPDIETPPALLLLVAREREIKQSPPRPPMPKAKRGFATMSIERMREIASLGGRSVPADRRAFSRDRELAARAGRIGGEKIPGEGAEDG